MDELLALYQRRASVRKFKPEPLREGDLEKLLFAAQRAPTDATAQLYSLLRISDPALRRAVSAHSGNNPHIETCAEFFLILADTHRLRRLVEHRGGRFGRWPRTALHFAITDAVLAGSALATMAESLGYGIVWVGGVLNGIEEIARLCGLPPGVVPVAGLCVGVPDETPPPRPRLPRHLVVHENRYQDYAPEALEEGYEAMAPIARGGDWYRLLAHYFTQGGTMEQREPAYRRLTARQGFEPDLPGELAQLLAERGLPAGSLGELIQAAFAQGFHNLTFRPGHIRVERGAEVYQGEGPPGEALARALLLACSGQARAAE
ncbi:NADPH-dependent oxidoreductase [Meiothermus sp. QL-1]|uniref:nitroreductase family protein n=1 Tax=Meiothermus sp. QL-1 TaxID=2058095 RepID=UPI000E0B527C|nr:nitroreductase family protein [Meiothermus sp. QL-1]RDI95981.1 NADPH-dependent oxidoreductase [Meiothermus sp. QL-1]